MTTLYAGIALFFGLVIVLAILSNYKFDDLARFKQFLMKSNEGFQNQVGLVEIPEGIHESDLAPVRSLQTEKLIASETLIPFTEEEAVANWSRMTSEKCFKVDMGEKLKPVSSYLQRTNNYQRTHPDSCSAPNHEFVGTFYRPRDGIGATPASGLPLPLTTQCM